ncbi:hypothetical protein [Thermofilum sp.]|uniref:hypothetical protein n=1 Tax=Thermofilum sp. TaxID=1961369 RepID=UPI002584841B|nr:hypothetical protein [Thermofilum sp.]
MPREVLLALWGAVKTAFSMLLWLAFPIILQTIAPRYISMPSLSLVLFFTGVSAVTGAIASILKPTAFKPLVSMIPRVLGFLLIASTGTNISIDVQGTSIYLDLSPIFYLLLFLFVLLPTLLEAISTLTWWLE